MLTLRRENNIIIFFFWLITLFSYLALTINLFMIYAVVLGVLLFLRDPYFLSLTTASPPPLLEHLRDIKTKAAVSKLKHEYRLGIGEVKVCLCVLIHLTYLYHNLHILAVTVHLWHCNTFLYTLYRTLRAACKLKKLL